MESTKKLKLLHFRDNVFGFVPSLPTLLSPPHSDLPNSCHFKFMACFRKEKRKVWWKYLPAGWIAQPSILPLCLLTYLTPRASTMLRASHLYVVKAESWGLGSVGLRYFSVLLPVSFLFLLSLGMAQLTLA